MYTDQDLDAAIAAGHLSAEQAEALRGVAASRRTIPLVDEENFRLLTGFNDIFVAIALIVTLSAAGGISHLLIAPLSWGLAEFFTRRRRMALPSILLLSSWVGGVFFSVLRLLAGGWDMLDHFFSLGAWGMLAGTAATIAAFVHWKRFRVPVTVAAGAVNGFCALLFLLLWARPSLVEHVVWLLLLGGSALFALAMWWDGQDRTRTTRRSDVAFWLHLSAAPLLVHPVFALVVEPTSGVSPLLGAGLAVGLYLLLGLVALVVDRRALLVSALVYVLIAVGVLIEKGVGGSWPVAALTIGSGLLLLSSLWHTLRRRVVQALPVSWQARLPVTTG